MNFLLYHNLSSLEQNVKINNLQPINSICSGFIHLNQVAFIQKKKNQKGKTTYSSRDFPFLKSYHFDSR